MIFVDRISNNRNSNIISHGDSCALRGFDIGSQRSFLRYGGQCGSPFIYVAGVMMSHFNADLFGAVESNKWLTDGWPFPLPPSVTTHTKHVGDILTLQKKYIYIFFSFSNFHLLLCSSFNSESHDFSVSASKIIKLVLIRFTSFIIIIKKTKRNRRRPSSKPAAEMENGAIATAFPLCTQSAQREERTVLHSLARGGVFHRQRRPPPALPEPQSNS